MSVQSVLFRFVPILAALSVGGSVALWPSFTFVNIGIEQVASRLSVIFFFSLLIERTVEIVMSIWRSEEANKRESQVQRLIADKVSTTDTNFIAAQSDLIEFKAETLQYTMPFGFVLGILIAASGIRTLNQFIDPATFSAASSFSETQHWWFNMMDIFFTGALLAGGADPIHKILDLYRKFMESSSAKAAGTKQ